MTTWTQFCPFLTTTYLNVDIFNLERGQKLAFLDHLPPLFVHVVIECSLAVHIAWLSKWIFYLFFQFFGSVTTLMK